jgi:hypothetical protein
MTDNHLAHYSLAGDGTVRHWLACGPVLSPLDVLERVVRPSGSPFGRDGRWIIYYWAFDPASLRRTCSPWPAAAAVRTSSSALAPTCRMRW